MKQLSIICFALIVISKSSFSQWNTNPAINTPVCTATKYQHEVRVISDNKGGAIAAWLDHRNDATFPTPDSSNTDIYVQRLDKNGYAKWALDGLPICVSDSNQPSINIVTDGASGAILVWKDERAGNNDIYAQRVDSSGNILWTANGVSVCSDINNQKGAKAVSDGNGGAIVSWENRINGPAQDYDIYAQRINGSGSALWGSCGKPVCTALNDQKNPRIETDDNGGAIIVWEDFQNATTDLYAQRMDPNGNKVWSSFPSGVPVCITNTWQVDPKIEPDGSGGVFIVWQDSTTLGPTDILAQRINSSGAKWAASIAICIDPGKQSAPDVASEGVNGAVIAWKDWRGGNKDIYAQKVDLNGVVQWAANGIPIVSGPDDEGNPNLWGDWWGGVICVWQDTMGLQGDVYAQKIDANGNLIWAVGGAPVATAVNQQTQPKHVPDDAGGAIFFFMDNRSDTLNYDIYSHHLYWNGTTNGIHESTIFADSKVFPNPFSSSAIIEINSQNRMGDVKFSVYNLLGETVEVPFLVSQNKINISRGNLQSGIYFYEIISHFPPFGGEGWGEVISKGKLILADQY